MATLDRPAEVGGSLGQVGPGARLRAKRESMGLSMEQVADKLRLDVRFIQALEQDNHTDIAAPVFVRGYLRSYAALLQLPADAIVECYAAGDADTAALFDGPAQPKPKLRISAPELHWLMWVIGAACVVAVAIFFGTRIQNLFGVEHVTPSVVTASRATPKVDAPPQAAADAVATTNKLVLRLSADSWVVISDAKGKELVYELMRAGSERVIEVTSPLQVVLGNSPAVAVEYNGEIFDQSRFSSGGVARFKLGAEAR